MIDISKGRYWDGAQEEIEQLKKSVSDWIAVAEQAGKNEKRLQAEVADEKGRANYNYKNLCDAQAEIINLEKEVERLKTENEILKGNIRIVLA